MEYYLLDLERTIVIGIPYFWRSNKRGYTCYIDDAGKYRKEIAEAIVNSDRDNHTIMIDCETISGIMKWKNNVI